MIDSKLAGTGNSRFLKSVSNFKTLYPTYDDFVAALIAGTLPIDLNGINPDGWTQQGTPLNKANLLSDDVANGLGLVDDATPNGAFNAIISAKGKSNGFATLDSSGKVPSGQLPSMDYIPTSQKGAANGVASLNSSGLVPESQIPTTYLKSSQLNSSVTSTSTTTPASSAAVKTAYDKAVEANSIVNYKGTLQDGSGTGSTLEYAIKKCGKIATVKCTITPGPTGTSPTTTFTFPEDILKGYMAYYSGCPLPIVGDSIDASGSNFLGYAYWGANGNAYVSVVVPIPSGKTGNACFTMISEI